jgi:hypothetical protein
VVGGQAAAAHAVEEDRNPERLGERAQLELAVGPVEARAGHDHRALGLGEQPRRLLGVLGDRAKLIAVLALLRLMQPIARLVGRLRHGLFPFAIGGQTVVITDPGIASSLRSRAPGTSLRGRWARQMASSTAAHAVGKDGALRGRRVVAVDPDRAELLALAAD